MTPFGTVWKLLFIPFTFLYGMISFVKNLLYDSGILKPRRVPVPVISIGNLTAGGTGKTPVTAFVAQLLTTAGKKVGIVSRGYGRLSKGTVWVCREGVLLVSSDEGGDEPVELAMRIPRVSIVVGESRFLAAEKLLQSVSVDVILVDDGFQHRQFHRDIDILVQDLPSWLSNRFQLPSGRFRESWKHAKSADALIWTKGSIAQQTEAEKSGLGYLPESTFLAERQKVSPVPVGNLFSDGVEGKKFFAFCGIGLPTHFISDALNVGIDVSGSLFFSDHHSFSDAELADLCLRFARSGADAFLTTLKDVCRLQATESGIRFLEENKVAFLPFNLIPTEADTFNAWLMGALEKLHFSK